jgi:hypothetical protein
MRKNSICSRLTGAVLTALAVGFVLGGCSAMPRYYGQIENYPVTNDYKLVDDPAPDEELCTLVIAGTLELVRIGEPGQIWEDGSYGGNGTCYLKITAGERTLEFDYFSSNTTHTGDWIITETSKANSISITYEFEPGHTYRVFPEIDSAEKSVAIGIEETSFPVRFGWRMGPYLGWHRNIQGFPFAGPFILAQAGITLPAGSSAMEFLAEANAGLLGYNPFEEGSPLFNVNAQAGGTANFYFGKSWKKTGFGLGGGVSLAIDNNDNGSSIPYVRVSFFPSYSRDWHIRLFADYSFYDLIPNAQKDELWKRFGAGVLFFTQ